MPPTKTQNNTDRRISLNEQRLKQVEDSILTLNHELGIVIGELKSIKWFVGGVGFAVVVNVVVQLLK